MATRNKLMQTEGTRLKIKTSQIINRLQNHIFDKDVIITATQMKAAEILLKKSLPDLTHSDISLDPNANKLEVQITHFTKPIDAP